jgi:hypothetical protein
MPETPMHEDDSVSGWEDQIWLPWQFLDMQAVAKTHSMNKTT